MLLTAIVGSLYVFSFCVVCTSADVNSGWIPFPAKGSMVYTTTQFVTNWALVENVAPTLSYTMWEDNIMSLGYDGPLGSFGPLGKLTLPIMFFFFVLLLWYFFRISWSIGNECMESFLLDFWDVFMG